MLFHMELLSRSISLCVWCVVMARFVDVLLPIAAPHPFTYRVPEEIDDAEITIGVCVVVPFRSRYILGVVWSEVRSAAVDCYIDTVNHAVRYRDIRNVIRNLPKLKPEIIEFVTCVADYSVARIGMVLRMLLCLPYSQFEKIAQSDGASNIRTASLYGARALHNRVTDCAQGTSISYGTANTDKTRQPYLNAEQQRIAESIIANSTYHASVIHGVTGSGKTEVYVWLARQILELGGQVLVLVPEIVLTTQLLQRFMQYVQTDDVLEWHSALTPAARREAWRHIASGTSKFIVGARSALFLPYANLKMIVVDEEHDLSFKQEDGVVYHARDMAVMRAKIENIPIIMASATPSMETFHNVETGKYEYYRLCSRYGGATLPSVKLLDMRPNNAPQKGAARTMQLIHSAARQAIIETKQRGGQTLIFVNRRGYAPTMLCTQCCSTVECPNCSAQLVYHKSAHKMQCHYCGYHTHYNTKCSICNHEDSVIPFGFGVERVAEEIEHVIPGIRLTVLTSDTVRTRAMAHHAVERILNNEVDVIIGTQMITKGLHFPHLKLVIVASADPSILGCDMRALEHTYQTLHQVMGRAGREGERGTVLIQTTNPSNNLFECMMDSNMHKFAATELAQRKEAGVPPFTRLVAINCTSSNERILIKFMHDMVKLTPISDPRILILGPAPAPLCMIDKKYRYRIIVCAHRNIYIQKFIREWLRCCNVPSIVRIKVDVDPYNFL